MPEPTDSLTRAGVELSRVVRLPLKEPALNLTQPDLQVYKPNWPDLSSCLTTPLGLGTERKGSHGASRCTGSGLRRYLDRQSVCFHTTHLGHATKWFRQISEGTEVALVDFDSPGPLTLDIYVPASGRCVTEFYTLETLETAPDIRMLQYNGYPNQRILTIP